MQLGRATLCPPLAFLFLTALLIGIGIFSGTLAALPRPGRWTLWIKRAAGILMLAMAEYYFVKMGQVWI